MENKSALATVIEKIQADNEAFAGKNLGAVVEAIYHDNGDKALTNNQCVELTEKGGELHDLITVSQLRGKAVNSGYYAKKTESEKASEHGTSQVRKASIVSAIETILSMPKGSLESLGKAQKPQLQALSDALIAVSDKQDADSKVAK
jgi:hypothetical protein